MIRIEHSDGRAGPVLFCDHCGGRIDDAELAWYEWLEAPSNRVIGEVYFLHKRCVDPFEREHPSGENEIWANMELEYFPIYLGYNLNLNWEQAHERAMSDYHYR